MQKKIAFLCTVLALAPASWAGALDFAFRFMPQVSIPVFDAADSFSVGGGGAFAADFELFNLLAPFVEAGFNAEPTKNTGKSLLLTNGGIGLGLFAYPIPRLKARVGAGAGMYLGSYDKSQTMNYYWKTRAELGYRFSPGFTLSGGGEYIQYLYQGGSHYSGLSLGITVDINLGLFTNRSSGLLVEASQDAPVFPVFYSRYAETPIGEARITNTEQAELRNVEVSFRAGNYSSRPRLCASFPIVQRGETVAAPLTADFNDQILTLSENTKVQAEVIVAYNLLDTRMEAKKAQTIRINKRNEMTWEDERMAAAFVSSTDPAVLEYGKYLAGLIRDRVRPGIDNSLQYGMGFFEGLRLSGVSYSPDPTTPYRSFHREKITVDYLNFPHQTLAYRSGDSDDLSILYAAALESVGIPAAFIPTDEEFLVAFALKMGEGEARSTFVDPSTLILRAGKAWVPVQTSLVKEGFMAAWRGGAKKWNEAIAAGAAPGFHPLSEAWKSFPPVGIPGAEAKVTKPSEERLNVAFENAVTRFITGELGPRVKKLLSLMTAGGTEKQHNALGLLYARYGLFAEAKPELKKAAASGYVPALINLGNIAFLEKNYEGAVDYFRRVLEQQPDNKAALVGLARAKYELDLFSESDELFGRVIALDPALAEQYAYLSSRIEGSKSRAASALDRGDVLWSAEEE